MLSVTIQGATLAECEANLLAAADEIREHRELRAQGCTCDLSQPTHEQRPMADGLSSSRLLRCSGAYAVCEHRKALALSSKGRVGSFAITDATEAFARLSVSPDGTQPGTVLFTRC